ncbi:DUF5946 family protein [Amnibacterium endophyticum]|uniref:DUF5946 family protein n=1 Tax=Amnibacterium endophyticum TaxID=2109337 RepID=A0ABW4LEC7_9MICO
MHGGTTACSGCGIDLPAAESVVPEVDASAACTLVHGEILGFQVQHPVMLRYHQMTADAYTAQHAGGATPLLRVGYALAGLWLSIEHGFSGEDVRSIHRRMGRPTAAWPVFEPPRPPQRWLTVVDVAEAGVRQRSERGHAKAVSAWAESVWETWQRERPGTDDEVERLLAAVFLDGTTGGRLHGTIGAASAVHRLHGLLQA